MTARAFVTAVRRAYLELEDAAANSDQQPMPGFLCVQLALAGLGVTVSDETAAAMLAALYVSERETTKLLPNAVETLEPCISAAYAWESSPTGCTAAPCCWTTWPDFGISHYFDSMIASCDVGQMKPHPRPFTTALAELGVAADEAVMVGDDPRADIGGALALGMGAVWIRRPVERTDPGPAGVPVIGGP